ncbi:Unknown protein [Striga hermonthica]|uniref:Uncharacterized protein n=1 Tax=Striga hermonthica TaxID=68872 RepID=A0A9N7N0Y8_STRHE|nr:Unknown protein [Striga hermonthica]
MMEFHSFFGPTGYSYSNRSSKRRIIQGRLAQSLPHAHAGADCKFVGNMSTLVQIQLGLTLRQSTVRCYGKPATEIRETLSREGKPDQNPVATITNGERRTTRPLETRKIREKGEPQRVTTGQNIDFAEEDERQFEGGNLGIGFFYKII